MTDTAVKRLVDKNELTRAAARLDKMWITSHIMQQIKGAMFSDAMVNGTPSWDMTLQDIFSIALQSALAARVRDIARFVHYVGDEYMKWEDVKVVIAGRGEGPGGGPGPGGLPEGFDTPRFVATFKLRYRKGEK